MNTDIPALPDRLIFFDGLCFVCNASVSFVSKRDHRHRIFYSPLQGITAEQALPGNNPLKPESLVYIRKGKTYTRSDAVLKIAGDLGGLWPLLLLFWVIPSPIRNGIYTLLAKNRYRWFGKRDSCRIPENWEKKQYLA